ncbi:MAG: hypothetical protein RSD49_01590 [Hafnia sp.]
MSNESLQKPTVAFVGDLPMADGRTWRQQNLEKRHEIAVGSLVEVNSDDNDPSFSDGLRLYVHSHTRDCDGTPLYCLTHEYRNIGKNLFGRDERPQVDPNKPETAIQVVLWHQALGSVRNGLPEGSLTVIKTAEAVAERFKELL